MPYRGDEFAQGHYYHIYNRGAGGGLLFFNPGNYEYCLRLAKRYYQKYGTTMIAYCLMPNHYHFLLRQETDVPLSKFINVLFNAYVQAVNRQQGRSGTLFAGRFRCVWVDREEYFIQRAGTLKDEIFIHDYFATPEAYQQFVADYQDEIRVRELIKKYVWD
jgi:putative transposase